MNYRRLILLIIVPLVLTGCISRSLPEVSYYLLEYNEESEKANLRSEKPLAPAVHIEDTELPRAFVRRQIVNRLEGPEYQYLRDEMWGDNLSEAIPRLIESRIRAYNLFGETSRNFNRSRTGYVIYSHLDRIEFVHYEGHSEALVEIELTLADSGSGSTIVRHRGRRNDEVKSGNVGDFVENANRILLMEIDLFLRSVAKNLAESP